MELQIETDIPLPEFIRSTKYPFSHMAINESVFLIGETINGRAYRAAMTCGARHGSGSLFAARATALVWRSE